MPDREWDTDRERERKRQQRARHREEQEQQLEAEEQRIRDRAGYTSSETRSQAERRAAADRMVDERFESDEEAYVQREVAITRMLMEQGSLKEVVDSKGRGRLARSEAYARWRWREYQRGSVGSL